jgi:hypothetical protein
MKNMKIIGIRFIDIASGNAHEFTVGRSDVESIEEYLPGSGTDRLFYDVRFIDGSGVKLFNFDSVKYIDETKSN